MKHVTFSRPIAPYNAGDKRVVPDGVAAKLQAEGALSASEPWPANAAAPAPPKLSRQMFRPERPRGASAARLVE